jgi:regulator of protease activity HflC (stomatin/prohibitin superfamily)
LKPRSKGGLRGLEIVSAGIRDVILPGDMKDLMNKVTEAKKAAEANLIVRREETAAMRSQANTAKLLEGNPTLMRLRELEVLEKVIGSGKLKVVLGEKGLAERIVNLI